MALRSRFPVCALALATALPSCAAQVGAHDPVMAKEGNTYYLLTTGTGITLHSSSDMRSWKREGRIFATPPSWAHKAAPDFKDDMVLHADETADNYKPKLKVLPMALGGDAWPTVDPRELNNYQSVQLP